jgi:diguanylate cyclase (GGDEF)-like protein/PAS domain S-box-containing protein
VTGSADHLRGLAKAWLQAVAASAYVPMSAQELEDLLHELLRTLVGALEAEPFSAKPGARVGAQMVRAQMVGMDTLERSLDLLTGGLLDGPDEARNLVALFGALATGYANALRRRTLEQQEDMKRALLFAKQRAERVMRATENRFREVFTSSPIGVAITDLDGGFLETNPALEDILGTRAKELVGRSLTDYLAEDEPNPVLKPPRGRLKLVRDDDEVAWVFVAMSPLRDGPGEPTSYVTIVQDLSELQLLQGQFGHQLMHDALTGAANRISFESRLERQLGQAGPDASVTLCCLNLDAFSVLNDGLGHQIGDHMLRTVAKRLEAVVDGEIAVVARTGGDEFAILIEDGEHTLDVPALVERINDALAEPEYFGGRGVALTASIGVVRCPATRLPGAELLRAADSALHAARAGGRRQWMLFDPRQDERTRQDWRDASALPGAFESGELEVGYQPVVRLTDRQTVAMSAGLRWTRRPDGPLDEQDTARLAERTGHSILFGPWLLRQACENNAMWRPAAGEETDSVLRIRLSRLQSADDDLVAAVLRAIGTAEISPRLLEIAFDTGAVLEEFGSAPDNLQVVDEIGVRAALWPFNGGPRELALLAGSPARSVILDDLLGGDAAIPVLSRAVESLVVAVKEIGARVSVDGVATEDAARRWAGIGVDTARGPLFGDPADLDQILSGNGSAAE